MLNTATSYLALLQEEDLQFKSIALDKWNLLVDENWSEMSDYIKTFKSYHEQKLIPDKLPLIALILSKWYYNLEDYDSAIEWALESGDKFSISENSWYVSTILRKILDKYISIRKHNFFSPENKTLIDQRIHNIVNTVFIKTIQKKNYYLAIGFCLESYDLDRLSEAVEQSDDIPELLKFLYELTQSIVVNTEYKSAIWNEMLKMYIKHAGKQYMDVTNCQFLWNNTEALASTLINILSKEDEPLIAYQIAFDLVENQNPSYLRTIVEQIKKINEDKKIDSVKLDNLLKILSEDISWSLSLQAWFHKNKFEPELMKSMIKAVEKGGSVVHLGVILSNSWMNSHTQNDDFLKKNIEWVATASNWARFCATSSLGAIHMGNFEKGQNIMRPYMPGSSSITSIYAQGGAYYGLGLIYANSNNDKILKLLRDALNQSSNNKETIQHGIFLAIGLVAMGTHDQSLYEQWRDGIYTDDAIIGEAAGYAVGLVMAGSKDAQAIDDLIKYSHDTQHEKIIRAIAIALSLIVYGVEESADSWIEQMQQEKDPILRYGAMYCIGMAYAGTGNTTALKKWIKFSVSDVSDDVRRAALINIGFLEIRDPDILFDKINVISLLSESYNNHVRYGAVMAIGIACAGTAKYKPFQVIEPLFNDTNYLVRQACWLATGMIFSQTTSEQEPGLKKFQGDLGTIISDKDAHVWIRFGAWLSKGMMELGGKNCTISLVNSKNKNKMSSIIGMALFTQYYYWFPMIHFIHLAVNPSMLIGIDSNLKIVKNYEMLSKAKPSWYGYPVAETSIEKSKVAKTEIAVLSTHSRVRAKVRKTGSVTLTELKGLSAKPSNVSYTELKPAEGGKIPTTDDAEKAGDKTDKDKDKDKEKEKEKEETKKVEEPNEERITNPFRIIPLQKEVIEIIDNQIFEPIVKDKTNGFVMLRKVQPDGVIIYEDFQKVEIKDKANETKDDKKETNKDYKPIPAIDDNADDIPDDMDLDDIK